MHPVTRLDRILKAAGIPINGLSPGANGKLKVYPESLQAAAQPIIDTFNPNDPAHAVADLHESIAITSRHKDILAMCGVIVRYKNITGWNAMTDAEKVTATLAAADVWATIRQFIDDKV